MRTRRDLGYVKGWNPVVADKHAEATARDLDSAVVREPKYFCARCRLYILRDLTERYGGERYHRVLVSHGADQLHVVNVVE